MNQILKLYEKQNVHLSGSALCQNCKDDIHKTCFGLCECAKCEYLWGLN